MQKSRHLQIGRQGEQAAQKLLVGLGWKILANNWRQGRLELDLVCRESDTIVFVEVKTRAADGLSRPDEAFTPEKGRRMVRAAKAWLAVNNAWALPCRFDLINVVHQDSQYKTELIRNVIELGQTGHIVGGGDTAWQPW